jgi:hypothetical protein
MGWMDMIDIYLRALLVLRDFLQNLRVLPDAYLQLFFARMHLVLFLPAQGVLIGIYWCDM